MARSGIPHVPVYGVGMPTVDGITGVLQAVAGGSDAGGKHLQALWVNMREEPVVYINGRPFVLREEVRPRATPPVARSLQPRAALVSRGGGFGRTKEGRPAQCATSARQGSWRRCS